MNWESVLTKNCISFFLVTIVVALLATISTAFSQELGAGAEGLQNASQQSESVLITLTDSRPVFTNQYANKLVIMDANSHEITGSIDLGTQANKITISHDRRTAYVVAENAGKIFVVDVPSLSLARDFGVREPSSLALSSDATTAFVPGYPHTVSVVDIESGKILEKLTGIPWPGHAVSVPERGQILVAYNEGIAVIDEKTRKFVGSVSTAHPAQLVVAPGGDVAFASSGDGGNVSIINLTDLRVTKSRKVGRWTVGLSIAADGSSLFVVDSSGAALIVLDPATLEETGRVQLPNQDIYHVLVPANGKYAFVGIGSPMTGFRGEVVVVDVGSMKIVDAVSLKDNAVGQIAPLY